MKKILLILLFISSLYSDCGIYKQKVEYYENKGSKCYTGDFSDVIKEYQRLYEECLKDPKITKQVYRKPAQKSIKDGYLF